MIALFVNGPWNGSLHRIPPACLSFEVLGAPTEIMGRYVRVPALEGGVSFTWERAR